jgi:hypothetical protein
VLNGNDRDIGSFLLDFTTVDKTAAGSNGVGKQLAKIIQSFEVVSGDGHARFDFDWEKIRLIGEDQINLHLYAERVQFAT